MLDEDRKLFLSLTKLITDFEDGEIALRTFIDSFDTILRSAAERIEQQLRRQLRRSWGRIEVTYALEKDAGRESPGDEGGATIQQAMIELRRLLDDALRR